MTAPEGLLPEVVALVELAAKGISRSEGRVQFERITEAQPTMGECDRLNAHRWASSLPTPDGLRLAFDYDMLRRTWWLSWWWFGDDLLSVRDRAAS